MEITTTQYGRGKRIYKWCNGCGGVTRHVIVPDPLKGGNAEICDTEID